MKTLIPFLILTASAHAATIYSIDINDADDPITEAGWTGLNANHSTNGGTVNIGGVDFSIDSSDGSRVRGTSASPNPNALTGDFAFDDGAGQAVILLFGAAGDLPAGIWQVEVWAFDSSGGVGDQILGLRTNGGENNAATINGSLQANGRVTDNMGSSPTDPAATFTFLSDGVSRYDVFVRENNGNNRSRLNAVRLTSIPEPSSAALAGLGGLAFLLRRKR
ncbi:hypothetical protein NT6N_18480 [Oceaniferula spumae]|uniref:Ice-binding protein C-terminal domain-containing protein n=1 Tax=Oceaniferula spumae TaxID=2979115 RepID=A0AAT9FLH9_9BACT